MNISISSRDEDGEYLFVVHYEPQKVKLYGMEGKGMRVIGKPPTPNYRPGRRHLSRHALLRLGRAGDDGEMCHRLFLTNSKVKCGIGMVNELRFFKSERVYGTADRQKTPCGAMKTAKNHFGGRAMRHEYVQHYVIRDAVEGG